MTNRADETGCIYRVGGRIVGRNPDHISLPIQVQIAVDGIARVISRPLPGDQFDAPRIGIGHVVCPRIISEVLRSQ